MSNHLTRRSLLGGAAACGLGLALPSSCRGLGAREPGRMLVLGGTRFLGPEIVRPALDAGWEVTLFNRGQSNPELFADLELRVGDRDAHDLESLREGEWDLVVDTSGYAPEHVRESAELLRDRVGLYLFVSTISVYADQGVPVVEETAPLATVDDETLASIESMRDAFAHYGAMKAYCELAAEAAMPGRVANVRPGLIVGPGDRSDRFTYWPVRTARGGEVLAPGTPEREVQFIDVRDLGAWCFELGSRQRAGVYNAIGFDERLSIGGLLDACDRVTGAGCSFTWVGDEFLLEHEVRPYADLPLWLPDGARGHIAVDRALAEGLRPRPIEDTIRDTLAWHRTRPDDHAWRAGLAADREAELLADWTAG